ncbi:MAG: 1-deoxy-D-xylulose-5-phosphate reductoisomerase [Candidatus Peribacteraceae bacterium]|nr:1-deoxy-D-xylulose-5-phosphate reductoisomerase [Candidatus Peribacteraceae bacterium]
MRKNLIILGATGSIGQQTLQVVRENPREFRILGLAGGKNLRLLEAQIREFKPKFFSCSGIGKKYARSLQMPLEKLAAQKCDLVVSAISGVAGLAPTLAAIQARNSIALANKESLVLAGKIVMAAAKKNGVNIFPIDSEHSAVWQLLQKVPREQVRRIILTASGGALRDVPLSKFPKISPKQVLAHPTWQMGAKITLDCATLANKAFEIIEAAQLFDFPLEKISAVIHPQSLVHALVETIDGNIFAQISRPTMKLPIALALFEGKRKFGTVQPLDLTQQNFEFRPIDPCRYPLFFSILKAAQRGGIFPAAAAAASEHYGAKFLAGEITFPEIAKLTASSLRKVRQKPANLKNILATVKSFQ